MNFLVHPKYDEQRGVQSIGVMSTTSMTIDKLVEINDICPAREAGIQPGDTLVALNGKPLKDWLDFLDQIAHSPGKRVSLTILRNGEKKAVTVTPAPLGAPIIGLSCRSNRMKYVRTGSCWAKAGVKDGDTIVRLNDKPISNWSDLETAVDAIHPGPVTMQVSRDGQTSTLHGEITNTDRAMDSLWPFASLVVDQVIPGFPAAKADICPGDRVLAVNGLKVNDWKTFLDGVQASFADADPKKTPPRVQLTWSHGDQVKEAWLVPKKQGMIGVAPKPLTVIRKFPLLKSITMGSRKCIVWAKRCYLSVRGLLTRKIAAKQLGGPIMIVQVTYYSASGSFGQLLYFIGLISINLGLFNLAPLPILDGGHIALVIIEKIIGRPVSDRIQNAIMYTGLAMLLSLFLMTTYNDLNRIFHWSSEARPPARKTIPKQEIQQVKIKSPSPHDIPPREAKKD